MDFNLFRLLMVGKRIRTQDVWFSCNDISYDISYDKSYDIVLNIYCRYDTYGIGVQYWGIGRGRSRRSHDARIARR